MSLIKRAGEDKSLDVLKVIEQAPIWARYAEESVLDTTDLSADTRYYPSDSGLEMGGYKDFSLTGRFVDADGTITMTIEVTNDESPSADDWVQIYGYDPNLNSNINEVTVTSGTVAFAWDFDNFNYKKYRIKLVNNGATNTIIIKQKRSY